MHQKRRLGSLLLAFLLIFTMLTPAAATNLGSGGGGAALQHSGSRSIQYAVIQGKNITASGVVGDQSVTSKNLYGIGSVSKIYTATAVMQLVEAGKISLDAPVVQYLPEFTMADWRYSKITMRMLLNHSSGLYGSTFGDAFLFGASDQSATKDLLKKLKTQRLKAEPGAVSIYCNDGFTLAQLVVERVSGLSFTDYLNQNIFTPLGDRDTATPENNLSDDLFALAYYAGGTLPVERAGVIGTAGIYSNAEALAVFASSFYRNQLLSKESVEAMTAPEYQRGLWQDEPDTATSYGLGFDNVELLPFSSNGIKAIAKNGDTPSYHASIVILPEYQMAAAVLSSGGGSTYNQLLASSLLVDALAERGIVLDQTATLPKSEPAPIPAEELDKAGYYAATALGTHIDITADGILTCDAMPDKSFTYHADGSYRDENNQTMIKLVTESDGQTYAYQQSYVTLPGLTVLSNGAYFAQKLTPRAVVEDAWKAWEEQTGTKYLLVSEKASSAAYLEQAMTEMPMERNNMGYVYDMAVLSPTTLQPVSTVPGSASRDYQTITLKKVNGITHLQAADYLFVSEENVKELYAGEGARCNILPDGLARWYRVGDLAGRKMSVVTPAGGAFYVYDSQGNAVASSVLGQEAATLPQDGYMVFVGKSGDQFLITVPTE